MTSQFLHVYNTDNYNPYKITYKYIYKLLPCDKKPERYGPIKAKRWFLKKTFAVSKNQSTITL